MSAPKTKSPSETKEQVKDALSWLEQHSTQHDRENLKRFGISATKAFGVSMSNIQVLSKRLGRNHDLAAALWKTRWYEARMLTSFVDEPALVTPEQMDQWCREFDNWGICDTVCFHLFDRTPYAWDKVGEWAGQNEEFVKRAAFALLASLAGHDKTARNEAFAESLHLIEHAATDERNFVKKGVSWALRRIGRRNQELHSAALPVAQRLAASTDIAARWVGKDALRELTKPSILRAIAKGK